MNKPPVIVIMCGKDYLGSENNQAFVTQDIDKAMKFDSRYAAKQRFKRLSVKPSNYLIMVLTPEKVSV